VLEHVLAHPSLTFQSATFIARRLQRTLDRRRICLTNLPSNDEQFSVYIEKISSPYVQQDWHYYNDDRRWVIIEYNEDIGQRKTNQVCHVLDGNRCS
jgi:hypothetical protein